MDDDDQRAPDEGLELIFLVFRASQGVGLSVSGLFQLLRRILSVLFTTW